MSHRLQHLQKRKPQQKSPRIFENQDNRMSNNSTFQQFGAAKSKDNYDTFRPILEPTKDIKKYEKKGYEQGEVSFPPPQGLYKSKETQLDPCFLRATSSVLHSFPHKTSIPIVAWITPFANNKVNVVDVKAPLRCNRCRAYVNLYFQFNGIQSVTCNLCGLWFKIEQNIDRVNMRSPQIATRHIMDFRVLDKAYIKKKADIIKVIIAIEFGMYIIELEIVETIISSLKSLFENHVFQQKIRIGIVFYCDKGVGFLRNGQEGQQPTIFLVPNNRNNIFCCPLSDNEFLLNPTYECKKIISYLEFLRAYASHLWKSGNFTHQANYINAIQCIRQCFDNEIGKIVLFSLLDPKTGPCFITYRNEEEQQFPLKPLHQQFQKLAKELVNARIGVDHFYFSKDKLLSHQLVTTHFLSTLTGGQLHVYNGYNNDQHSQKLYYSIYHTFTKPTYYNVDLTCRCSTGLTVLRYGGPEGLRVSRDIAMSILSNSTSFTVEFNQEEKLVENKGAYIQFALIYTNGLGQRRIRVINYRFAVSSKLEDFYCSLDYLTFANAVAKKYVSRMIRQDPIKLREDAIVWLAKIIAQYRTNYQIIKFARQVKNSIPEALKWAFSYLHVIFNGKMFLNYAKTTADLRIQEYLKLYSSNPYLFSIKHYPRVYLLTFDIYESESLPGDYLQAEEEQEENVQRIAVLPTNLPLTKQSFSQEGVYLYDQADQIIILVQSQAKEQLLTELFGTSNWEEIQKGGLPELETSHNIRVNNIVSEIRRRTCNNGGQYQPILVKTPLRKGSYNELFNSILKQNYFECSFFAFLEMIKL